MTIQRQYSLPNCTLILQGLGEGNGFTSPTETRPIMSILMSVECHIMGQEPPLRGGREFFEHLVTTVSQYTQTFFSSVKGKAAEHHRSAIVQLQHTEQGLHRLTVQPPTGDDLVTPAQMNLTTVQLFDLVEAIDQFFADAQTLPSLTIPLVPLPKNQALSREPVTKQALPVALGASSLAIAATALFYLPIPEVRPPKPSPSPAQSSPIQSPGPASPPSGQNNPSPSPEASPSPSPTTSPSEEPQSNQPQGTGAPAVAATAPEITDSAIVLELNNKLRSKIEASRNEVAGLTESLTYQVSMNQAGDIVGFKPLNSAALANQTLLLNLTKLQPGSPPNTSEPLAQFRVVFTPTGGFEINPLTKDIGLANQPQEITETPQLKALNSKLYEQIREKWKSEPNFPKELVYQVRVSPNGVVTQYEPINQPAYDYAQETPLPGMAKPSSETTNNTSESFALFKVVLRPNGVLEVSPWRGYR